MLYPDEIWRAFKDLYDPEEEQGPIEGCWFEDAELPLRTKMKSPIFAVCHWIENTCRIQIGKEDYCKNMKELRVNKWRSRSVGQQECLGDIRG